jgi:hypothetical protein
VTSSSKFLYFIFGQFFLFTVGFAQTGEIAGLRPYQRPAAAPVISVFEPTEAGKSKALRGIHEPQVGVGFLKDQGAWYTPFNRPNMPGRYDIRGLHDTTKNKKD